MKYAIELKPILSKEELRTPQANKSGGKECKDKKLV